jgi:hypothetical protein
MTTPYQLATAYYLAAQWHDKQAAGCEAMAKDEPRLGPDIRARAAENARHHRGSAAGLRLAATGLGRKALHEANQ